MQDLFEDYEGSNVRELIINVLIKQAKPLRQVDIKRLIQKIYPKKSIKSKGTISMSLKSMEKVRTILSKTDPINPRKTKYYYVNPDYVTYKNKFYEDYLEKIKNVESFSADSVDTAYIRDVLLRPSSEFKFKTLKAADEFVTGILSFLVAYKQLTNPRIVAEQLFNRYWLYESDEEFKDVLMYFMFRSKFSTDWRKTGWFNAKKVLIRTGVNRIPESETMVCKTKDYGEIIIELFFGMESLKRLGHITNQMSKGEIAKSITRLTKSKGDFLVNISSAESIAKRKREIMFNNFKRVLFSGMINRIVQGLKAGEKVIPIFEKYAYMTKEQAVLSKQALSLITYVKDNRILNRCISDHILSIFSKDIPVSLIDLGVGPAIKPIGIYSLLTKSLDVKNYIAVDASEQILELAGKDIGRFGFDMDLSFINLSFEDMIQNPQGLLSQLPDSQRAFLFLGGTYGNVEKELSAGMLKKIMRKGDIIVIDLSSLSGRENFLQGLKEKYPIDPQVFETRKYDTCLSLYEMGFDEKDIKFEYIYDKKKKTVNGIATVLNVPKVIFPELAENGLKKGQKFRVHMYRKLPKNTLKKELEALGLDTTIVELKKGKFNIALCVKR